MLSRDEAIEEACSIMALAVRSIGNYQKSNDGFCRRCPHQNEGRELLGWTFSNSGEGLAYVRRAVIEKLKKDGFKIAKGFDPKTGIEIHKSK